MTTPYAIERLEQEVQAVLERHGDRASIDFRLYRGRPVEFAREVLKFEPYETQAELLVAPLTHKYTVARGNHAAGKDATFACLLLYEALVEGKLCLALSATERQLLSQLWVEVRRRFRAGNLPGALLTQSLEIGGIKRILAMTSGNVSNLSGYHDPNGVCIVISEGQGEQVEKAVYDSAFANAADDRSVVVAGGNPVVAEGRFYEIHKKSQWHQIRFSALDHPNVVHDREVIPGGPTRQWIQEVAAEYGETSAYYTARVLGEFPMAGSIDRLVTRDMLERAFALHESGNLLLNNQARQRLVADIARGGPDSSCEGIIRGRHVESLTTFREPDLMRTAKRLHARALEIGRWNTGHAHPTDLAVFLSRANITIDDNGVGGGCTDRLRELEAWVTPYLGQSKAHNEKRYANRRAESHMTLRDRLLRGTIALPRDEKLAEDLLEISYSLNDRGQILIEKKDIIKARLGRSPDRGDTVVMSCDAGNYVLTNDFYV